MTTETTRRHTTILTINSLRETWPAGLLEFEAEVAMDGGRVATLRSRASVYLSQRGLRESRLTLASGETVFGEWVSLACRRTGDEVEFRHHKEIPA